MAQPWQTIDRVETGEGVLELRKRGDRDFMILINNRVLMNSSANRSEIVLGERACRKIATRPRPRVLIGGLGMGLTLKAALDSLPDTAQVVVSELNPAIVTWCCGPLAMLTNEVMRDPRVSTSIEDVAAVIARAAQPGSAPFDAILLDLYEGPGPSSNALRDPFYGSRALKTTVAALSSGGVFAVWGENPDASFEKRLTVAGFIVDRERPGRGGLRHVVYVAQKSASRVRQTAR